MIDMQVELLGRTLRNPVLTASGTCGSGFELSPYLDLGAIGGVVGKGTTLQPRMGNPPGRLMETKSGLLNCIGLENPGVDALVADLLVRIREMDAPYYANISGNTVEEYGELARRLDVDGVAGLEVNISCPNVKAGGLAFGTVPEDALAVTRAVKRATSKPIMVKLSPNVTDIQVIAKAVEEGGADAISLINTLLGMSIDTETKRPALSNTFGGLSGPAIKPVGLRMVYQVYQAVSVPIVGLGGIMSARDALEYIMAGATAVQVGTATLVDPRAAETVARELRDLMEQMGEHELRALIGAAHRQE